MRKYVQPISAALLVLFLVGCSRTKFDGSTVEDTITGEEPKESVSFPRAPAQQEEEREQQQEEAAQQVTETLMDLSGVFQGIQGCAVIYSPEKDQYAFYDKNLSEQGASPYSTFKIISTLSGLQNGVLENEESKMNYTGIVYGNPAWNGDLTLKEAFQNSCVWYFRQVVDKIGESKMQEELQGLLYGNCDISEWSGSSLNSREELNGFWLGSSLKISPLEQVKVLTQIFEGQSNYQESHIELLKNIMLVQENGDTKVYGKTGSGGNGEAWFVGFSETDGERDYFAIFLMDREQKEKVSGNKAKEIALEIFS